MSRLDGRRPDELRELKVSLGDLERADGSGRFAFGPVAALASFTGPIEVRLREELVNRATLEVVHRPLEGIGGATPSRALVTTLEAVFGSLIALTQFPRSLCQLIVQSLSPTPLLYPTTSQSEQFSWPPSAFPEEAIPAPLGGSTISSRAASINASALALLHSGSVGAHALPFAVSLANYAGRLVLDPTAEEERVAESRFGFAWAFGIGIGAGGDTEISEDRIEAELVWAEAEGEFSRDQFDQASIMSLAAAQEVLAFVKQELEIFFMQRCKY